MTAVLGVFYLVILYSILSFYYLCCYVFYACIQLWQLPPKSVVGVFLCLKLLFMHSCWRRFYLCSLLLGCFWLMTDIIVLWMCVCVCAFRCSNAFVWMPIVVRRNILWMLDRSTQELPWDMPPAHTQVSLYDTYMSFHSQSPHKDQTLFSWLIHTNILSIH